MNIKDLRKAIELMNDEDEVQVHYESSALHLVVIGSNVFVTKPHSILTLMVADVS